MTNPTSFLPEDYVRDARERRSSLIALALFLIVMGGVFAAFLVTNRQWTDVRTSQGEVNERTEQAAKEIAEMKRLEGMRAQMVEKAELARGLIEPVPRSVLLATLVNTMPENLSLLELELKSEEIKVAKAAAAKLDPKARRSSAAARAKEAEEVAKLEPVRRRVLVQATGVAPDDLDVSRWMSQLSRMPFLSGIRLEVSEEKELRGMQLRQFRISMRIEPEADIRGWEGLQALRTPADPIDRGAFKASEALRAAGAIESTGDSSTDPAATVEGGGASPALVNEDEMQGHAEEEHP